MENDTNTYTFTFYHDPGHGWLAVPHSLLAELQVEISSYSYMDNHYAYLEEDEDAAKFLEALRERYPGVEVKEVSVYHPGSSWIRGLPSYQPPQSKQWMREIAGKTVMIQSCWVDVDRNIVANIHIGESGELLYSIKVRIAGRQVSYPFFSPFKKQGKQMTHAEFEAFLKENFQTVLDLITSLLEPAERRLLELAASQESN